MYETPDLFGQMTLSLKTIGVLTPDTIIKLLSSITIKASICYSFFTLS